ncbi:MAG: methylenetetrahydrofolate reductase C-terminal domain-containing protein [Lentisphaeria bacterium]|jgi:methylenetetrahydrofolate reductase (NADPH)|nr:methylenetetrahydrofolate reductase C-terminal domain-containing protein [Lentisphaeria bacterium]
MEKLRNIVENTGHRPFMVGVELVTTRGSTEQPDSQKITALGEALAEHDGTDWISITDNAGGTPMMAPGRLARQIHARGTNVAVHLTCKDRNRNALEAAAWQYDADGLGNILCLTGDYPIAGFQGTAAPVFDLDSTTLVNLLSTMNAGMEVPARKKGVTKTLGTTDFFLGCAASPFKTNEAELVCQYLKLELKLNHGAHFVIPQLGYDMRKSHELMAYLERHDLKVPVFGNIFVLSKMIANAFHKQRFPGCQVSDRLLKLCTDNAAGPDKGKAFFLEFAAKQYACMKGLGYRGAYFGGINKAEDLDQILTIADTFGADDWHSFARDLVYPMTPDFYLFAEDESTGLANPQCASDEMLAARDAATPKGVGRPAFSRLMHDMVFEEDGLLHRPVRRFFHRVENSHPTIGAMIKKPERAFKGLLFGCLDCGDCALAECQFLCPGANCRKDQRNGPCGGSRGPLCEAAEMPCLWYRAYHRAKQTGGLDAFLRRDLVTTDHGLTGTSSWANYFLGRDHVRCNGAADADKP